jgi:hypothetical protein
MTAPGNSRCSWAVTWLLVAVLSVAAAGLAVADDNQPAPGVGAGAGTGPSAAQPPPVTIAPTPSAPAASAGFPPQPPPAANRTGFLHQLGVWWNDGFSDLNTKMKDAKDKIDTLNKKQDQATKDAGAATQEALKNAAQATKDAATAVVRLPNTRMFELHDPCRVAANGAPDCQTAAINACRGKGFNSGQPLGISTSQVCPSKVLLSGQPPAAGECHDETVILGVVCQ